MLDTALQWIQGVDLLPRGEAMGWSTALLGLDLAFNLVIALSYVVLFGLLTSFAGQRPGIGGRWLLPVLGVVALASAVHHLHAIWTLWFPHYAIGLMLHGVLAVATMAAILGLRARMPGWLRLPTPDEVESLRQRLAEAHAQRQRAQDDLATLQETFDQQSPERVGQLEEANRQLQSQILSLRRAEREFLTEKERALVTLRAIADGVITTDTRARITYLNPVAERITGWSGAEAIGRPIAEIFRRADENTQGPSPDPVQVVLEHGESPALPSQSRLINRYGQTYSVEDLATPIRDRDGALVGVVLVFHDVSAARKMANRMSHLAQHDQLTGLPNRLLLNDRLNRAITQARRHQHRVALMFLDLDRFKRINDTLGHVAGDKLLKETASRLEKCVRASDTVSRQGGDEFVILLPQIRDTLAPAEVARKVLAAIGEPFEIGGERQRLTVSVGIAVFPDDGNTIDALTHSADSAMYHAKSLGRDNFQFFTSDANQRLDQRKALERRLQRALQGGEFQLLYQPRISLIDGGITGAEALLRWNHPRLGQIGPERFLASAEESGLIVPIGQWVIRQACAQSHRWRERGLPAIPISVNLSSPQLTERAFVHDLEPVLAEARPAPGAIEFELREDVVDASRPQTLARLADLGIGLAIDDFGAGETSVAALHRLPIGAIKLDGRLVRDAADDPDHAALVQGLIDVGQRLRKTVVAKGIENVQQLQFLRRQGCQQGQGFLFGKPLAADAFERLFARRQQASTTTTPQAH
ncbi:MAG: EAL domain-containing protein [Burkholderiaceae bacterium]